MERMLNLGCGERYHPDWINVDMAAAGPGVIVANLRRGIPFPDGDFGVVYHSHLLEHLQRRDAEQLIAECFRVLRPGGVVRIVVPDLEATVREYLRVLELLDAGDERACERYEWIMIELLDQLVRTGPGGEMLDYLKRPGNAEPDYVVGRIGAWAAVHLNNGGGPEERVPVVWWRRLRRALWRSLTRLRRPRGGFRESGEVHQWMYDRYSLTALVAGAGFREVAVVSHDRSRIPSWSGYGLDIDTEGKAAIPVSLYLEAVKPGAEG
jgi:predicted SAM-dependent methyltransferase